MGICEPQSLFGVLGFSEPQSDPLSNGSQDWLLIEIMWLSILMLGPITQYSYLTGLSSGTDFF